ncbi:MAG: hypothetical protein E4G96_02545 [Chrysiogenales bacterium]|nr:MAG: hypothetical protein E4G96_02545 [Chrysiogenales bacterium]
MIKLGDNVISHAGETFVDTDGTTRRLNLEYIKIVVRKSPKTGAVFPAEWDIIISSLDLQLHILPVLTEQELRLKPVTYWEGAVKVSGTRNDNMIYGKG